MPLVILHQLLNVSVQLANKRGLKQKIYCLGGGGRSCSLAIEISGEPYVSAALPEERARGSS
jgi:hypothetical protein